MRPIGFSTGALAFADFRRGVDMINKKGIRFIELSALRQEELRPLFDGLDQLELSGFSYISVHAPSKIHQSEEEAVVEILQSVSQKGWPIILHPDAVRDFTPWRRLGKLLCVENMDKRKSIGRTVKELNQIFEKLPDADFCFDIGHARQVDPTMNGAYFLLKEFGKKLIQVHLSEVNTGSRHDSLSLASILAFQEVAEMIPDNIPIILETTIPEDRMESEVKRASEALSVKQRFVAAI
jgi:endonuclease IV